MANFGEEELIEYVQSYVRSQGINWKSECAAWVPAI